MSVEGDVTWHRSAVHRQTRTAVSGGEGLTVWLTGLSGSGKSTIAVALEEALLTRGRLCYRLDGDNLRHGLNSDLGFSPADRAENVRRIGEVALLMADAGAVAVAAAISPYREAREAVRSIHATAGVRFVEVFVDAPLAVCSMRDPKGLYARARAGEVPNMTGVSAPYEAPDSPDLRIDTTHLSPASAADRLLEVV